MCGHSQVLGCGAQFCLVGQEQAAMQELRDKARHQFAIHPPGLPSSAAQKTVKRF